MTSVVGPNVKLWSDVILVLPSMTIKLSIVGEKKRVPLNVTKIKSDVMLVLHNVTIGYGNFCLTRGYSARPDPNGSDFTWLDK